MVAVRDLHGFPVLRREPHGISDVPRGDDDGRRQEPGGSAYPDHVRFRAALRVVEITQDTDADMRELRGIGAGRVGVGMGRK
jgi:hypothetical protein